MSDLFSHGMKIFNLLQLKKIIKHFCPQSQLDRFQIKKHVNEK